MKKMELNKGDDNMKKIEKILTIPILVILLMSITGSAISEIGGYVMIKGKIAYSDIEGGCTYLAGDDGKNYELLYNKPLPSVGTRVNVAGYIRNDMVSICMIGQIIQVVLLEVDQPTTTQSATFTTDKLFYRSGENVIFTIKNTGTEKISFNYPPDCKYSVGPYSIGGDVCVAVVVTIDPGKAYNWTWDQKVRNDGGQVQIPQGKYNASVGGLTSNDFFLFR